MNIIEQVRIIIGQLNSLDNYTSNLVNELSMLDEKTSDLLHLIENNKMKASASCKIIKEIREIRIKRRKVKQDLEISRIYNEQKNKLITKENRMFLIQELTKKEKSLNTEYKNRQYTDEELKELLK